MNLTFALKVILISKMFDMWPVFIGDFYWKFGGQQKVLTTLYRRSIDALKSRDAFETISVTW